MIRPWQLLLLLWLAFLFGPIRTSPHEDVPAEMLPESLLSGHGFDLSAFYPARLAPGTLEVRRDGDRVFSNVGVFHGFLALPFGAGVRALYPGLDAVTRARMASRVAGAFFTAAAVAVTFALLLRVVDPSRALLLCLAAAFASPLYSTASRWSGPCGPAAFGIALLLWLGADGRPWRWALVGAIAAALYFLRPPSLLAPVVLLATLVTSTPSPRAARFRALAAGAVLSGAVLVLADRVARGQVGFTIPTYATLAGSWTRPEPVAVAAYLVSPARSLFLFAPVAILAAAAIPRSRDRQRTRLAPAAALAVAIAVLEIACREHWWGGYGFGPHLLTAYVPLLAAAAAYAPRRLVTMSPLVVVPIAIAHGAFVFRGGRLWDERRQIDSHPEVVWDLRDSPLADLLHGPPVPDPTRLNADEVVMSIGQHPAGTASSSGGRKPGWFAHGWEPAEPGGTWAVDSLSWLVLSLPGPGDYELTLSATAPMRRGRPQHLAIEVPGAGPQSHEFESALWQFEDVPIRVVYRTGLLVIQLRPRHAVLPGGGDVRRCTFFVRSLRLERRSP